MDRISNLIIKLKNAGHVGHTTVEVPFTKLTEAILKKLEQFGYIVSFSAPAKAKTARTLEVVLKYVDGKPRIEEVRRISKLSRRVYEKAANLRPVRRGYGLAVVSTPKGILADSEARKQKVGGEVLFQIW
jgi:small subunit ribosomal protein S8